MNTRLTTIMNITDHFLQLLKTDKLAPFWILDHVTKTDVLDAAHHFLCKSITTFTPAQNQKMLLQGIHPNFLHIAREADQDEIKMESAGAIKQFCGKTPGVPGWRVIVIERIDLLNRNAANALLKTLEEPNHKLLILATTNGIHKILPTIRSRAQILQHTYRQEEKKSHTPSEHTNALDLALAEAHKNFMHAQAAPERYKHLSIYEKLSNLYMTQLKTHLDAKAVQAMVNTIVKI